MQCSTWWFIPSEATFRKYTFICTLNVQTILRKTHLPHGSDHRWALNRSITGFKLSWNHKRLTKTFPRTKLTRFTKQTLGMYPLGEHLSWLEFHIHSFWMFKRVSTILKSWEAHEDVLQERIEFRRGGSVLKNKFPGGPGGGSVLRNQFEGGGGGGGWIEQSIIYSTRTRRHLLRKTNSRYPLKGYLSWSRLPSKQSPKLHKNNTSNHRIPDSADPIGPIPNNGHPMASPPPPEIRSWTPRVQRLGITVEEELQFTAQRRRTSVTGRDARVSEMPTGSMIVWGIQLS